MYPRAYNSQMLYPVAPEKIETFKAKLNRAADAENLHRPTFKSLEGSSEELLAHARKFIEVDGLVDPVDGFPVIRYRGREYALVEVEWSSDGPLRDKNGDMVLYAGNAPVGPDPMAMWQVLFLLPA